ncbi:MAG TPA: TonB-dependent receptor [Puia sp.]|nr:TonB-dependent receptor [Puia sp.]
MNRIVALCLFLVLSIMTLANGGGGTGGGKTTGEETGGAIVGKVVTADGQPAADVVVTIPQLKKTTVTDDEGLFSFSHLKPGSYAIEISLVGYEPVHRTVQLAGVQSVRIAIQLTVSGKQLKEIIVVATRTRNQKRADIGKAGIAAIDLPQSVAVVDKDVLDRQQALTVGDALMNVSGIYVMGTTGGVQQEIGGRGYLFNSTNTFKNGMKFNNGIMPDISSVERLEFLKGSAAILLGNVTAGGVMNMVTRKPVFEQGGQISFRAGSYDLYKPTLDIYGPVSGSQQVAYRVVSSYEKERSFRDDVSGERYYINPSLLIKAGKKVQVLVEGDYLTDTHTSDFGVGAINYVIPDIPRTRFLGARWSTNKATEGNITVTTTYQINNRWQLRALDGFYNYRVDLYGTSRPDDGGGAAIEANGNWVRGVQRSIINEHYYLAQADLIGKFNTGSLAHQFLFGVSADKDQTNTLAYNLLPVYDSINIFDPGKYPQRSDIPTLTRNTFTRAPLSTAAAYVQDLVSLTPELKVLVGGRLGYVQSLSHVYSYATAKTTPSSEYAHPFTPRAGIVYQPTRMLSLFVSYSNSFTTNTGTDTAGKALPLSYIDQYEAGFKSDLLDRLLSLNLTVYRIVNSNLAQMSLANGNTNTNIKELAGQVTSKGVEADLSTKPIHGFTIMAGYSYNNARYTQSNTYPKGSKLQYAPANIITGSVFYSFSGLLQGLGVGLTGMYVNGMNGGRVPRLKPTATQLNYALIPLPDLTQLDATVRYSYRQLTFALKCSNLFNALGYYAHEDGSVNPIAPTEFAATVSCRL